MRHIVILGHAEYHYLKWSEWLAKQPGPVEVWGINNPTRWNLDQRVIFDVFFQIHERWSLSKPEEQWVAACPVPMYTCEPWPDVQIRREYPLDLVLGMSGVPDGGFLSCSFCYAIGLVCLEARMRHYPPEMSSLPPTLPTLPVHHTRLTLYGVELQAGSTRERLVEHLGVLFWVGYAAGLGIKVDVPKASSGLLEYPYNYGRSYHAEGDFARRRVKDFLIEARKERLNKTWATYDSGMRQREREGGD